MKDVSETKNVTRDEDKYILHVHFSTAHSEMTTFHCGVYISSPKVQLYDLFREEEEHHVHVRGPCFNPGWLPVFHSSLKIFPSLYLHIT